MGSLVSIKDPGFMVEETKKLLQETLEATSEGIYVIHQAVLFTVDSLGYADFLVLTKDPNGNQSKIIKGDSFTSW